MEGVTPKQRLLVQLITLPPGRPVERSLYRAIECGAQASARIALRSAYRRRLLLRDDAATVSTLVAALTEATGVPGVRAVDLAIHPHGTTERLVLADGPVEVDEIGRRLRAVLDSTRRDRLRAVFSTACHGASHLPAWVGAGFAVATGAQGIYADGVTSVPVLFRCWAAGRTVEQCVRSTNGDPTRRAQDWLASRYYAWTGRPREAERVDSTRVVGGRGEVTIGTDPARLRG
jgi:hypothetical protein